MKYRINYSKVVSQANSIQNNANQLNEQIKLLNELEQECRSSWKGGAADTFLSKLNQLKGEIEKSKKQMSNLASTIKYCADRIKHEDEEAEQRAQALSSGQ